MYSVFDIDVAATPAPILTEEFFELEDIRANDPATYGEELELDTLKRRDGFFWTF